jgi:hypothetical protein
MLSGNPEPREECSAALGYLFCTRVYFKISEISTGCTTTDNNKVIFFNRISHEPLNNKRYWS